MDMQDELIDRFGEIPKPVENLLLIAHLRALAHSAYVTEVSGNKQEIRISMYPKANVTVEKIPDLISRYRNELKFTAGESPYFTFIDRKNTNSDMQKTLNSVKILLNEIKMLLVS